MLAFSTKHKSSTRGCVLLYKACFSLHSVSIQSLYSLGYFSLAGLKYPYCCPDRRMLFFHCQFAARCCRRPCKWFIKGRQKQYKKKKFDTISACNLYTTCRSKCRSGQNSSSLNLKEKTVCLMSTPQCHVTPMRRGNGLIPLFGQMQLMAVWTKMLVIGCITTGGSQEYLKMQRSVGWFGLNRIWSWVRDGELASAGVGGLWVWCSETERERVREREAHPTATSDSDQPLGLQSAIIPNRCCASIISILHSCKVTICT